MDRDTQVDLTGDRSISIGSAAAFSSVSEISAGRHDLIQQAALVVEQGRHRFYTLVLPSSILAASCVVETRNDNPENGFQRLLDARRAKSIARYIDADLRCLEQLCFLLKPALVCVMIWKRV